MVTLRLCTEAVATGNNEEPLPSATVEPWAMLSGSVRAFGAASAKPASRHLPFAPADTAPAREVENERRGSGSHLCPSLDFLPVAGSGEQSVQVLSQTHTLGHRTELARVLTSRLIHPQEVSGVPQVLRTAGLEFEQGRGHPGGDGYGAVQDLQSLHIRGDQLRPGWHELDELKRDLPAQTCGGPTGETGKRVIHVPRTVGGSEE